MFTMHSKYLWVNGQSVRCRLHLVLKCVRSKYTALNTSIQASDMAYGPSLCGLVGTVNNRVGASYCDTTHWFLDFFWVHIKASTLGCYSAGRYDSLSLETLLGITLVTLLWSKWFCHISGLYISLTSGCALEVNEGFLCLCCYPTFVW